MDVHIFPLQDVFSHVLVLHCHFYEGESEGLRTPSQKTSLLGGVAQILINQDHPHV